MLKRLSIQSKLILMLLLVSLGSVLIVGYIGYVNGRSALAERIYGQLTSLRHEKASLLKNVLKTLEANVVTLSDSPGIVLAMREFRAGFDELKNAQITPEMEQSIESYYSKQFLPELSKNLDGVPPLKSLLPTSPASKYLQYQFLGKTADLDYEAKQQIQTVGDGSRYDDAHQKLHQRLVEVTKKFGWDDLLLVDEETGDVVYTSGKEMDFGRNLTRGLLAETNLGDLYRKMRRSMIKDDFTFVDFEPYPANLNRPTAFVGSPIFDGPTRIGFLFIQFPNDEINRIMTGDFQWEKEGLGKTGEVYLIGPDRLLRSKSRFFHEKDQKEPLLADLRANGVPVKTIDLMRRTNTAVLALEVKTESSTAALEGREGTTSALDYRGKPVVSAYGPLDTKDFRWGIVAKMDTAEAFEPINRFGRLLLLTTAGIALGVTMLALALASMFARPVQRLAEAALKVSQGALDVQVPVESQDEFGDLARAFNKMSRSLKTKSTQLYDKIRENEELLLNILPAPVASKMQAGDGHQNQTFADVTVLFADLLGFDAVTESLGADKALQLLNDMVVAFDEAAERFGVEKVKTLGTSYMAVCGLSVERPDHTNRILDFAQEFVRIVKRFNAERGTNLVAEIGINCGPVVGGVVGRSKFLYDLWGDTVTLARSLKSDGITSIQVTDEVRERVRELYPFEPLGQVQIKGKEPIATWTVRV